MPRRLLPIMLCLILWPWAAAAENAPAALRGKSVVVSWGEQRSIRIEGQSAFQDKTTSFSLSIYISSAGRFFNRIEATTGRRTGSADFVGAGGASHGGGVRQVRFSGRSLVTDATMTSGGARHVEVNFTDGFAGCAARVISAKQVGASSYRTKSLISGRMIEIRSVSVGAASCSIRDGNVFAH